MFCNLNNKLIGYRVIINYVVIDITQSHQFSHHHLNLVTVMLLLTPQLTPLLLYSWLMWRW